MKGDGGEEEGLGLVNGLDREAGHGSGNGQWLWEGMRVEEGMQMGLTWCG